eukprot:1389060-Rhodomonas_salina.1
MSTSSSSIARSEHTGRTSMHVVINASTEDVRESRMLGISLGRKDASGATLCNRRLNFSENSQRLAAAMTGSTVGIPSPLKIPPTQDTTSLRRESVSPSNSYAAVTTNLVGPLPLQWDG